MPSVGCCCPRFLVDFFLAFVLSHFCVADFNTMICTAQCLLCKNSIHNAQVTMDGTCVLVCILSRYFTDWLLFAEPKSYGCQPSPDHCPPVGVREEEI